MTTQQTSADAAPSGTALLRSGDRLYLDLVVLAIARWRAGRGDADSVTRLALHLVDQDVDRARALCAAAVAQFDRVGVIDETNPPCNNDPKEK